MRFDALHRRVSLVWLAAFIGGGLFLLTGPALAQSLSYIGGVATGVGSTHIAASGDTAYVVEQNSGIHIVNISNPQSPAVESNFRVDPFTPPDERVTYADLLVSGDRAYLLYAAELSGQGTFTQLVILNVSDARNPSVLGRFPLSGSFSAPDVQIGISGTKVYFLADIPEAGSLVCIETSNPASPSLIGHYPGVGAWTKGLVVSGERVYAGTVVFDFPEGADAILRSSVLGLGGSHKVALWGPYLVIAYDRGSLSGIEVWSELKPVNPVILGASYIRHPVKAITADANLIYAITEDDGVKIFDISNVENPIILAQSALPGNSQGRGIAVAGDLVLVAAGPAGLAILRSSNLTPSRLHTWDSYK